MKVAVHGQASRPGVSLLRLVLGFILTASACAQAPAPSAAPPIDLTTQPGCAGSVAGQLASGLSNCSCQASVALNSTQFVTFTTPGDGSYNILFVLGTLQGDATLVAWLPGQAASTAPAATGTYIYTTARTTESYLYLSGRQLAAAGNVTLGVRATTTSPIFLLHVYTSPVNATLDLEEATALGDIHRQCCSSGSSPSTPTQPQPGTIDLCKTKLLLNASSPTRTAASDICNKPPFICSPSGRLLRFVAPHAGLACPSLPDAFSKFSDLVHLDLSNNELGATTEALGRLVKAMPKLRRLLLRYGKVSGQLVCDMAGPQVQQLALAFNDINGTVPECIIRSPALVELYVSNNNVKGPLPDVFEGGNLKLLYALSQVDRTLTGPLPPSLSKSSLAFLALGGNALSGTIPPLPPTMVMFNVSDNQLTGELPTLPSALLAFEVAANKLSGGLPAGVDAAKDMLLLDVRANQLSGSVPKLAPALLDLNLASNSFTGQLPQLPPRLISLNASYNQLSGDVSTLPLAQMARLLMAGNQLTGSLTPELLAAPRLAALDLSGNQLSGSLPSNLTLPLLQRLALANNKLTGTLPGAVVALPSLQLLDLSGNQLQGNLYGAGGVLEALKSNSISTFAVGGNQLSGSLPAQLAWLALFDPNRTDLVGPQGQPLPRVFNVSGNQLTGAFPTYVLTQFPKLLANCSNGRCIAAASVTGPAMSLACPTGTELQSVESKYSPSALAGQQLECMSPSGERVPVVPYLQSGGTYTAPSARRGMISGAIAGLVIGLVALVALLAGGAWFVHNRRSQTYRSASHRNSYNMELMQTGYPQV